MFEFLNKVQIYETMNEERKIKLENALNEKNIEFTVEKQEFHNRNAFDFTYTGHITGQDKFVYTFWTTRKYKDISKSIIKSLF